jgi:hypothetical protein
MKRQIFLAVRAARREDLAAMVALLANDALGAVSEAARVALKSAISGGNICKRRAPARSRRDAHRTRPCSWYTPNAGRTGDRDSSRGAIAGAFRADAMGNYLSRLRSFPAIAEALSGATHEDKLRGMLDLPALARYRLQRAATSRPLNALNHRVAELPADPHEIERRVVGFLLAEASVGGVVS